MDVSEYRFSKHEIEQLQIFRDNQDDVRLKLRFVALLILSQGIELQKDASIVGKSEKTIENWFGQYLTKGIESLNSFNYKPKKSFLGEEEVEELKAWVGETNPGSLKQIREYARRRFKVSYTTEGIRKILVKHGLKRMKSKVIPGNSPDEGRAEKKQRVF